MGVGYHLQSRGKRSRTADLQGMNLTSYHLTIPQSTGEDLNLQNPKAPDLQSGPLPVTVYRSKCSVNLYHRARYSERSPNIMKLSCGRWLRSILFGFKGRRSTNKLFRNTYTTENKILYRLSFHGVLSFWQPYINHHLAAAYNPRRKLHLTAQTFLADFYTTYFLFLKL